MNIETDIKSTVTLSIEKKSVINLLYTGAWVKEHMLLFFKNYDISMEQYNVLRILRGQKGNPANLATIQERMINKMSNTTRLVDKLITKNLVTRQVCEDNRRKIEIFITKEGLTLLSKIDDKLLEQEKGITEKLTIDELSQLNKLLDKLRD